MFGQTIFVPDWFTTSTEWVIAQNKERHGDSAFIIAAGRKSVSDPDIYVVLSDGSFIQHMMFGYETHVGHVEPSLDGMSVNVFAPNINAWTHAVTIEMLKTDKQNKLLMRINK